MSAQEEFSNCGEFYTNDTNGVTMDHGTLSNTWEPRTIDLSSFAGCQFQTFRLGSLSASVIGDWDLWFADMALTSSDGTVVPLYYRQGAISSDPCNMTNVTNPSLTVDSTNVPASPTINYATTFYAGDHLGSAQMEFAMGGWPVWQGQFAPFAGELKNDGTPLAANLPDGSANHYKFTGKERDTESGLDYFGARYYSSNMGRFMSPGLGEQTGGGAICES